jgi:predicted nucleotidyltransferase
MSVTTKDYQEVTQHFTEEMKALGEDVVSVILYGSMARGDVRPGKSDLMDAYVFLRKEVFEDRTRFLEVLQHLVQTCVWLSQTQLPYHHPFHYYSEDEVDNLPATFLGTLRSEGSSKILLGEDIRPQLGSSKGFRYLMKTWFFLSLSKNFMGLANYLHKEILTWKDCVRIINRLASMRKFLPVTISSALRMDLAEIAALEEIKKALPSLDFSVLDRIKELRDNPDADMETIREVLRETLTLVVDLRGMLLARWKQELDHSELA